MEFIKYNSNYAVYPRGFHNLGFTCYYNALLQSLISCTSFNEELLIYEKKYNKNPLLKILIYLIKNSQIDTTEDLAQLAPTSWHQLIKLLEQKSPEFAQFAAGQQCAAEGFSLFLQILENYQGIQNLFFHRRRNKLYCNNCNNCFSNVEEMNNLFEVEPSLNILNIN